MNWSGGCYCGEERYQASRDPEWVGNCHCTYAGDLPVPHLVRLLFSLVNISYGPRVRRLITVPKKM
jgi:hypothetical protein